jgi:branched-chain amino acid transport system substrate-binding protein
MSASAFAQTTSAPVHIGYLADLTGPTSGNDGEGGVFAARMAIADYGGSVLGRKVDLMVANHGGKPDVGLGILKRWYEEDDVSAVMSIGNSTLALAAQQPTRDFNRVLLITTAVSSELTNKACSPNSVHWLTDNFTAARAIAGSITRSGAKSWYFLTVDYAMGKSLEADAIEEVKKEGGAVLGAARHPFVVSDFSSFLLQAQASGAQVLGIASSTENMLSELKQAKEYSVPMRMAPFSLLFNDVRAGGLDLLQGLQTAQPFYWDLNDSTRAWAKRFFAEQKKMPTEVQSDAYRAVIHYLQAVDAAGTLDGAAVVKKMKEIPIHDQIGSEGRIRADGRVIREMYLFQVKSPAESKSEWDLLKVVGKLPSSDLFRTAAESECPLFKSEVETP